MAADVPVKAFAAIMQKAPGAIMSLAKKPIKTLADFPGKTIALPNGVRPELDALMMAAGLDRKSVNYVPVGTDPGMLIPGVPSLRGTCQRSKGGYILNGRWPYASGADHGVNTVSAVNDPHAGGVANPAFGPLLKCKKKFVNGNCGVFKNSVVICPDDGSTITDPSNFTNTPSPEIAKNNRYIFPDNGSFDAWEPK